MQTTQTIPVQAGSTITLQVQPASVGNVEHPRHSEIPRPKHGKEHAQQWSGIPKYIVEYTSNAGRTARYGVFWNGFTERNDGLGLKHRLGLKRLTKTGRMSKGRGFFIFANKAKLIETK